jgi:hypothetical protein
MALRHRHRPGLPSAISNDRPVSAGRLLVYCGPVDFASWEGEQQITVQRDLRELLPIAMRALLGISEPP